MRYANLLVLSLSLLAQSGIAPARAEERAAAPKISDLAFLEGSWSGSDGTSTWETVYTGATGGQIVGASKEIKDGRAVMIDFEHFYLREGALRMTPFPFGKRSEAEFTLTAIDAAARTAVFENPQHDFPRKFTYRAAGDDRLFVELVGEMDGSPVEVAIEFTRR